MGLTESRLALRVYGSLSPRLQLLAKRAISPTYTLGAVVVLRRSDGRVLLVCQSYRPGWALPGGIVDRGEEPRAAAERELVEELGLSVSLPAEPVVVIDVATQQVDCVYVADVPDALTPAPRSREIERAEWFAPSALPHMQPEALLALRRTGIAAV